jgi:hypothetical protein
MSTGYACPVCDAPQADMGHLANHLAFTAMLRSDGHGDWLDERVPDWSALGEADLTAALREHAADLDEENYPQVFEDTTGDVAESGRDAADQRSGALFDEDARHGHGHQHDHDGGNAHDHGHAAGGALPDGARGSIPGGELSDEDREAIVEEAREMTRELRAARSDDTPEEAGDDEDEDEADPSGADG